MIKWGIIGLGHIAHEFAEGMKPLHAIYGVAARDLQRARTFQKQYDVQKVYESYDSLIEDEEVDVVYIATVNSQHYKNIMKCLKNGKHVLCEKAIWGNYQEMKIAYEYAKEHNLILSEAMTIYHMPLFEKIQEMIKEGRLGKIKYVQADLGSLKEDDPENRFFSKALGGGAMLDIGTYTLSFLRYFLTGEFETMKHVMIPYPTGVDEMWSIGIATSTGEMGNANMTFRAKLPKRAIVAGDKAYVTVYNYVRADRAVLTFPDGKEEEIKYGKTEDALTYEIRDIENCIQDSACGKHYIEYTMDVVKVMDELLQSE
ncbi:MAG: Gfo/Idh/MocA family oxidoreductase [Hespellia sp.]|nr:Gfo/Idh/MocA family oxidoreductase [Hespellia sp.]